MSLVDTPSSQQDPVYPFKFQTHLASYALSSRTCVVSTIASSFVDLKSHLSQNEARACVSLSVSLSCATPSETHHRELALAHVVKFRETFGFDRSEAHCSKYGRVCLATLRTHSKARPLCVARFVKVPSFCELIACLVLYLCVRQAESFEYRVARMGPNLLFWDNCDFTTLNGQLGTRNLHRGTVALWDEPRPKRLRW
jgi:hypothetical protein